MGPVMQRYQEIKKKKINNNNRGRGRGRGGIAETGKGSTDQHPINGQQSKTGERRGGPGADEYSAIAEHPRFVAPMIGLSLDENGSAKDDC